MKYRIIQTIDGKCVKTEPADVLAWAIAAGLVVTRLNDNPRQRAELQGRPILPGFYGPMWDGDAIRYEDAESYRIAAGRSQR